MNKIFGCLSKNVAVADKRFVTKKGVFKTHVQKLVVTEDEQVTKESALSEAKKNIHD